MSAPNTRAQFLSRSDRAGKSNTEVVQGARNSLATLLQDVGVDHGRGKIVVPEQLLNGAVSVPRWSR
jgi:hypothetical protein